MKRFRILFILIFIIIIAGIFFFARSEKIITGRVIDCDSNTPIANVVVSVNQRGWGAQNNQMVWDKDYITSTQTDKDGYFSIPFTVGSSANIKAAKDGYFTAQQNEYPKQNVTIKMKRGNQPNEITYNCRPSKDCLICSIESGVQICKNVCVQ